jgi:Tol biopolymer transport system component/DNA-binding winged helix-turn-helix (wHTH) protein
MSSPCDAGTIFRFGMFQFDAESRQLFKRGIRLKPGGQPMEVLLALLERPGEIVSREELRLRLWPGDLHVEFEANLNKVVNRLRAILGDSPERPTFIETVPGRGYRFVAPLERIEPSRSDSPPALQPPGDERPRIRRRIPILAAGLAGGAVLALGAAWLLSSALRQPPAAWRATPLTSFAGRELSASFSPDGNSVAFVWEGEDHRNLDIYTLAPGSAKPTRITSDPAREYSPAWSPDGRRIAYLRDVDPSYSAVMVAASDGSASRQLRRVHTPPTGYGSNSVSGRMLAWSRNSLYLAVPDRESPDGPTVLYALSLADASVRRITQPSEDRRGHASPAISLDGRWLAYIGGVVIDTGNHISIVPVSDDLTPLAAPRKLPMELPFVDSIDWSADGRDLVAAMAPAIDASRSLYRAPALTSGPFEPLPGTAPDSLQPAVSPTGRRLVYMRRDSRSSSIWSLRLPSPGQVVGPARRLVVSTSGNMGAEISPDGRSVAYRSLRSGVPAVWVSEAGGPEIRQISPRDARGAGYPSWSADGKWIAMQVSEVRGLSIRVMSADGTRSRVLVPDGEGNQFPTWSRDGRWIYFSSSRTGRSQIWKAPSQGGTAVQVTRDGGWCLKESPDGKSRFVSVGEQPTRLIAIPAEGGTPEVVLDAIASPSSFAVASAGIYYLSPRRPDGTSEVRFYDSARRTSRMVMATSNPADTGLSLSLDETTVVFTQIEHDESTLMLIEGFR